MKPTPRYQPGDKIGGRYQVHQALMGGMGEVYLCLDLEEMYPFALKTFQQRYQTGTQRLRQAFEKEVATWVALEKHPNIVRCFYLQTLDNQPFMILEWIAGEEGRGTDLRGWLRHGPLDLQLALDLSIDVCRGLIHAQEKQPGLVHRDLKPENILVAQGRWAKITDFGLADIIRQADLELDAVSTALDGRQSMVGQKGIAGTPAYMAPEQWRGESLDERADVYALGCILYEMLSGESPFQVDFRPTTRSEVARWLREMQAQHENSPLPSLPASLPAASGDLAQSCLAKARAERPSLTELLRQLENLYQGQFATAPRAALPVGQFTDVDHNNRGTTYADLQRYDEALRDYDQAIALNPNDATAYYNRGLTYHNLQRYDEALRDYDQAIALNPNDAQAYNNRGNTYHNLQHYDEALRDYDQAITLNPNYAQAYNNRGNTYHNLQRYDEALRDFDQAITLNPNFVQAYYNRGTIYDTLQRYDEALRDFDQAIALNPNLAQAYNNRGNTYTALQRYDEALRDYDQAIALNPNYAQAYFNLGALLASTGQLRGSLPCFEKAAQFGEPSALQAIAQVRQALGMETVPQIDPAQQALEAFQQAGSVVAMQQAVAQFPSLARADFIATVEQTIAQQIPPQLQPAFQQRLAWLRQITNS